ncbi:MAG: hypothetical protein KDB02_16035 [Acidimicrobiales bacterium]|nr:hypothetical protein [Acidimicrobiales bacterium]
MRRRSVRNLVRVLAVAITAVGALALTACDPPTPDNDAFYTPPDPLPSVPAGAILRSRPSTFTLDPVGKVPVPGVTSTQILYRSTSATGQPNAVSGTVLVPTTPWLGFGKRPLVTFGVGTRGLGDQCAPSYTLANGVDYEGLFIKGLLDLGWAVVVSDYEGLGTPGVHTYVVGQSEGRALLDAARAAQQLPGSGLASDGPVGIMGYSQGGGAAGWAAQLESTYAPELNVKGTVAGGVPGDLEAVAEFGDGTPFVAFALMAALGIDSAYPDLDLTPYLNAKGQQLVSESDDVCLVSVDGISTMFQTAFSTRSEYTTSDPLATPAWQARLRENKLGGTKPAAPVYQFHGIVDEIVPYGQARDLRRTWCNKGANVTWATLPGEHVTAMVEGYPGGVTWLGNRFLGLPTFGNCILP